MSSDGFEGGALPIDDSVFEGDLSLPEETLGGGASVTKFRRMIAQARERAVKQYRAPKADRPFNPNARGKQIDAIAEELFPHPLSFKAFTGEVKRQFAVSEARREEQKAVETEPSELISLNLSGREDRFNALPPSKPANLFKTVGTLGAVKAAISIACPTDIELDLLNTLQQHYALHYTAPVPKTGSFAAERPIKITEESMMGQEYADRKRRENQPVCHQSVPKSMPPDEDDIHNQDSPAKIAARMRDEHGNRKDLVVRMSR